MFDFRAFGDWAGTGKLARVSGAPMIVRRWPLRESFSIEEHATKSNAEQIAAVETYISIEDAVAQVQEFVKQNDSLAAAFGRSVDDVIIIAIGSETVVSEDGENEFQGDISLDAYSALCLPVRQKGSDGFLEIGSSENLTAGEKVCFVSLRRLALVFPEIVFTDKPVRARSIAARYITSNTMAFVLGCLFTESLSHHNTTGCINETAWTGGRARQLFRRRGVPILCATLFHRLSSTQFDAECREYSLQRQCLLEHIEAF
ncbi:hypothetical protein QCE42_10185 [Caballeronia sp. LZ050]|uniref:hypothetical protein n=2 Tax=unclassified Caballeronia TaxID=2646786 RepID=UPI00285E9FB3|nr:hypothetical protein [Caballeronia sp. LZ050]MDR5855231.1 hypothetical protein [Caballeronia sp. LZ050]